MTVHIVHKARPPRGRRAIINAAAEWEPFVYRGFLAAVRYAQRKFNHAEVEAALARGVPEIAVAAMPWAEFERALERGLMEPMRNALREGAGAAAGSLRPLVMAKSHDPLPKKPSGSRTWYHGTRSQFDAFSLDAPAAHPHGNRELGIYFTADEKQATGYASDKFGNVEGRVVAAKVNVKKPFQVNDWAELQNKFPGRSAPQIKAILQGQGYDGVTFANSLDSKLYGADRSWVVAFSPDQVEPVGAPKAPPPGFKTGMDVSFTLDNPRTQQYLARHAARLVTNVRDETMLAIRRITTEAHARGVDVRGQATQIATALRRDIGLNQRQAGALSKYEASLIAQELAPTRIAQQVGEYRDRLIDSRARMIARNETMTASSQGQHEVWNQAQEQGLLPADTKRKIVTQPPINGNNPCPLCAPHNGEVRGLNEPFTIGMQPPFHIGCECTTVLVFED